MEKKSKAEEMFENKQASKLMNYMILKTYSRHAKLTEEEFLKEIGFEGSGRSEDEAINVAMANVLLEITKKIFEIKDGIRFADAMLKSKMIEGEKNNGKC